MAIDPPPRPLLLTFGQVAERLGVGVLTIRQWARTEQCPVVRDGRKVRGAAGLAGQQS
jgi:excisionase family DNA binding protein